MIYRIWLRQDGWQGLMLGRKCRLRFSAYTRHELFQQMGVWLEKVVKSDS